MIFIDFILLFYFHDNRDILSLILLRMLFIIISIKFDILFMSFDYIITEKVIVPKQVPLILEVLSLNY